MGTCYKICFDKLNLRKDNLRMRKNITRVCRRAIVILTPSNSKKEFIMAVLVGKEAPDFTEDVAVGQTTQKITLSQYKGKQYVVLFFYPLDFTFVCPTELHAFEEARKEFESRNAVLIGCSID